MSSFPDNPRALSPVEEPQRPEESSSSHAIGQPRGEEFDLSNLNKATTENPPDENASVPKWNRAWLVLAIVLAAYCFYFWVYGLGVRAQKPLPLGPITAKNSVVSQVRVHVAGAVARPGVVSLPSNARVFDALQKAGGALPNADANALNLADFVEDGAKIQVPLKAAPIPKTTPTPVVIVREVPVPVPATSTQSAPTSSTLSPAPSLSFGSPSSSSSATATPKKTDNLAQLRAHPVDLNHATSAQLQQLPGVGPKMAERILAYRSENGRFKSVSDLDKVKGFGEKKMEALKDLVIVK